jgi:DNA-binding NarL/FixJ family response regulator
MEAGSSQPKGRVLIVEDQFLASEFLKIWVEAYGFEVCGVARSAARAIDLAVRIVPDYVLMDVRLEGDKDGVDAALAIHDALSAIRGEVKTRIIYCTGSSEPSTLLRINSDHPFAVLIKPIAPADLGAALMAP